MHIKSLPMILTFNHEIMKLYQTSIFLVYANVFLFQVIIYPYVFIAMSGLYGRLTRYFSVVTGANLEIHNW